MTFGVVASGLRAARANTTRNVDSQDGDFCSSLVLWSVSIFYFVEDGSILLLHLVQMLPPLNIHTTNQLV